MSWFLIFALVTWVLATAYFPYQHPGWSAWAYWLAGTITAALFFVSVLLHELGHAVIALREGVPVHHITLLVFGGVAEIESEPATARSEFLIAAAGPLTSLGLAGLLTLAGAFIVQPVVAATSTYLGYINFLLAAFNLIPGFPLDGGRMLRAFLWQWQANYVQATRWATSVGLVIAYGFIIFGIGSFFFGNLFNGVWVAFIGWFLHNNARAHMRQTALRDVLADVSARELLEPACPRVAADSPLHHLMSEMLNSGRYYTLVGENGSVQGLVTTYHIQEVPRERWTELTAGQVMTPTTELLSTTLDEDVWSLLHRMEIANVQQAPIIENGRFDGLVSRKNLLRHLRLQGKFNYEEVV